MSPCKRTKYSPINFQSNPIRLKIHPSSISRPSLHQNSTLTSSPDLGSRCLSLSPSCRHSETWGKIKSLRAVGASLANQSTQQKQMMPQRTCATRWLVKMTVARTMTRQTQWRERIEARRVSYSLKVRVKQSRCSLKSISSSLRPLS